MPWSTKWIHGDSGMPAFGDIRYGRDIGKSLTTSMAGVRFVWAPCPICGLGKWVDCPSHREGKRLRHSQCDDSLRSRRISGQRHPRWKGGRFRHAKGYVWRWLSPEDPLYAMANCRGYVLEHRYVVAVTLGRPLGRQEIVHHINGKTDDNRCENLELTDRLKHNRWHFANGDLNIVGFVLGWKRGKRPQS